MKKNQERKRNRKVLRIFARIFAGVLIFILSIVLLLFGALTMIHKGPYPRTRALFVSTVMETSAAKFLAQMYMTDEEIEQMLKKNSVDDFEGVTTNPDDIEIPDEIPDDVEEIEIVDITGSTYRGKMMIVRDPSRIAVATIPEFGEGKGVRTHEIIISHDAVAGINAGGFLDYGGKGDGAHLTG